MRTIAILTAALLSTACDTPDSQQADKAQADATMAGDEMATDTSDGTIGPDGAMMPENVPAGIYVNRVAISDKYEIEAGKLAVQKAQSEQTRAFGQMMIDDHTKSSQDMKAVMAKMSPAATPPSRLDAEHQGMIDRLKSASGAAFDREYQNQQMMAHRKALALHEGYGANGDNADLKAFAQTVVPVIRKHHEQVNSMTGSAATDAIDTGAATGQGAAETTSGGQ